jgi:PBP1b-binding outer membrane lipoprotein LpoB
MKPNYLYFFLSTILTLLFISCSNESLQKIGFTKKKNNQFSVSRKAPLEMPPDMYLRPPKLKNEIKKNNLSLEDEELSVDDILNNKVNKKNEVEDDSMKIILKEKRILKKILNTKATILN